MKNALTLIFVFAALVSYSQISLAPASGCPGTTFDITITGSIPSTPGTPCFGITGVFVGNNAVITATNPTVSQASPPVTVSLTIPSNFSPGVYDFKVAYQYNGNCYNGVCSSCFTVNPKPSGVSVSPSGAVSRCDGQSLNLLCTATGATSYQWILNGNNINTATNVSTFASTSGTYACMAINACGSTPSSDSAVVTFHPLPAAPTITRNGAQLHAVSAVAVSYQWFLDGNVINGTDSVLTATQNGAYTVKITDANGCESTSAAYNYPTTGIEDNGGENILRLLPNPTTGLVTISTSSTGGFLAQIISVEGRLVREVTAETNSLQLDVSGLTKGIYTVRLVTSAGEVKKRLTVQ